jgi:GT2 family glycosyltransferase
MASKKLDVSIIIPFKDKSELTLPCLQTLLEFNKNTIKEVILISNDSTDEEYTRIEAEAKKHKNVLLFKCDIPFNFQRINNFGIKKASGKVVMMLNNDIELTKKSIGLLEKMYEKAIEPGVGAVGCILLYDDDISIQHAGVHLVPGGTANELYRGIPLQKVINNNKKTYGYDIRRNLPVSAITAAAMMVEKKKIDKIHGLNENFIICGGDVDLCLRLNEKGYQSWLIGAEHGYMIHKESKSRSMISVPYIDFVESYKIYIEHFDFDYGDPFLHWQEIYHEKE